MAQVNCAELIKLAHASDSQSHLDALQAQINECKGDDEDVHGIAALLELYSPHMMAATRCFPAIVTIVSELLDIVTAVTGSKLGGNETLQDLGSCLASSVTAIFGMWTVGCTF